MKNCCSQTTLLLSKIGRLISEGSVDRYRDLVNMDFGDGYVNKLKMVILAFLIHVGECFKSSEEGDLLERVIISYVDLAKKANQLATEMGVNVEIPLRGNIMGRIVGDALGLVSQATFILYGVPISKIVVQKRQNRPGGGFDKLTSNLKARFSNEEFLFALRDVGRKMAEIL